MFFTVSSASASEKLSAWVADSLPKSRVSHMHHVALRRHQIPKELKWFDRTMLKIAGWINPDRQAGPENSAVTSTTV